METYNYFEAVKADVETWINDHDYMIDFSDFDDVDDFANWLNDGMFIDDSVTGNASGSYTFNTYEAEENLCHNLDLLAEACECFGSNIDILKNGAEACDVTIRCYLLSQVISEYIEEHEEDIAAAIEGAHEVEV